MKSQIILLYLGLQLQFTNAGGELGKENYENFENKFAVNEVRETFLERREKFLKIEKSDIMKSNKNHSIDPKTIQFLIKERLKSLILKKIGMRLVKHRNGSIHVIVVKSKDWDFIFSRSFLFKNYTKLSNRSVIHDLEEDSDDPRGSQFRKKLNEIVRILKRTVKRLKKF